MSYINYGLDTNSGNVSDEFMKGIKEFNYKTLVLVSYNSTKAVIMATAQHNFAKEMVAGCYLAVDSLANMITPYIPDVKETAPLKNKINKLLKDLKDDFAKIYSMDKIERTEYVRTCEEVIIYLTPNLSRVGIGATMRSTGTFSYDQIVSNKMKERMKRLNERKKIDET